MTTVMEDLRTTTREAKVELERELEEIRNRAAVVQAELSVLDDVEDRLAKASAGPPPAPRPSAAQQKTRKTQKTRQTPKAASTRKAPRAKRETARGERVPPAGERIVAILTHREQATAKELAEALGDVQASGVTQACRKLVQNRQLVTIGTPRRGTETVYALPRGQASALVPAAPSPEAEVERDSSPADDVEPAPDPRASDPPENVTPISDAPGAVAATAAVDDQVDLDVVDDEALDLTPTQRRLLVLLDSYNWDPPRIALNTQLRLEQVHLELRKLRALRLVDELKDGTFTSMRTHEALVRRGAAA